MNENIRELHERRLSCATDYSLCEARYYSPRFDLLKFFVDTSSDVKTYRGNSYSLRLSLLLNRAGRMGLMGNLASIISLADPWRINAAGKDVPDLWWVMFLNALSLTLGVGANVLLTFKPHMLFLVSALYTSAFLIYIALIVSVRFVYFKHTEYTISPGFWQCVCGAALYLISGVFSYLHAVYFSRKQIEHHLKREFRRMEIFFAFYLVYIAGAAGIYHLKSMLNVSYSESVYFVIVTCLTLGYGDLVPTKTLPKALDIPLTYIGLVLGGIVTVAIFDESTSETRLATVFHSADVRREIANARIREPEEAFTIMTKVVNTSILWNKLETAAFTLTWLIVFWLIGALIFHYTEHWSYFNSVYSSAISLASVGYGDFVPKSPGGRSFFIYWALMAVPTVATAVSDVYRLIITLTQQFKTPEDIKDESEIEDRALRYYVEAKNQGDEWRLLSLISRASDYQRFSYRVWNLIVSDLLAPDLLPDNFWLSEISPLRNPTLNQRTFLLLACAHVLDKDQEAVDY